MHPSLAHRLPAFWVAVLGLLAILSVPAFSQSTGGRILGCVAAPIRTGWGLLYNPIEELVMVQFGAEPQHEGLMGKLVNDWAVSGITQFQSGFLIRLDTENDYELIASIFFLGTEAPQLVAPFQNPNPKTNGGYWFNPNDFQDPALGHFNTGTQRTICRGPGLEDWDFAVHKKIPTSESKYFQFRGEIFNLLSHTNPYNPDGHFSDGPTEFGRITQAQDPRLAQFALKFYL